MPWLYAIPSSDTGMHSRATACSRSLALMSARISRVGRASWQLGLYLGSSGDGQRNLGLTRLLLSTISWCAAESGVGS